MENTESCIFCNLAARDVICENELAIAIRDKFPAKPLHTLIIPKRHSTDIFETTPDEREAMHQLADQCVVLVKIEDPSIAGVNFGSNVGAAAGQKIFHTHIHLIPRRHDDMAPPPARPD